MNKNSTGLALVSPCSTCKNQRAVNKDGLPACPRKRAEALYKEYQENGLSTQSLEHLIITGNEGSSSSGYQNPVYSDDLHTTLVWIADIEDNKARYDSSGNLVNPDILDPTFSTNNIQCRLYPTVPSLSEAEYRSRGPWSSYDQLKIDYNMNGQLFQDSSDDNTYKQVLLEGYSEKVVFTFNSPRLAIDRDYGVPGT